MSDRSLTLPQVIDEAAVLLSKFIVPLYATDDSGKRPLPHGTGFFVRAGSDCFLVSAAHVFETLRNVPLYYYISSTVTRRVTGEVLLNQWWGDRQDDPVDIGVVKLTSEAPPPYPDVEKYAMDVSYLQPRLSGQNQNYLILGFPASRTSVNPVKGEIAATAYGYHATSAPQSDYVALDLIPSENLILPLDLKRSVDLITGRHRIFPRPQGMSGSPVWALYDDSGEGDPGVFPVVAVGTKYLRNRRRLIATDVGVVLTMIETLARRPT